MQSEPVVATSNRNRWLVALAIALAIPVLQWIPQALTGHVNLLRFGFLALQTPTIMFSLTAHHQWLRRRHEPSVGRTLAPSLAISVVVGALGAFVFFVAIVRPFELDTGTPIPMTEARVLAFGAVSGVVQCAIWTLGFLYPFTAEDARLRSFEAETLKLAAARLKLDADNLKLEASQLRTAAELSRMRTQLEPHFLLNTLNGIAGLVTQRPRDARRLLGCLGDLLRDALDEGDEMQTLDQEVAWLRRYAEILESRHAGFLTFEWRIADETRSTLLPRLLLQPLVENAVKHGAMRRSDGGTVSFRTELEYVTGVPEIVCTIEDNGPGMPDEPPRPNAFGLRSVRRRLELAFGGASFHVESSPAGTRTVVRLPRVLERPQALLAEPS